MSPSIPFVFASGPSGSSELDTPMPCYECSMLGYGISCNDCSRFTTTTPFAPPSSPASGFTFSFDFRPSLGSILPALDIPSTPARFASTIKQSCWNMSNPSTAIPSSKTSRFNWSEMDSSIDDNPFEHFLSETDESTSSWCDSSLSITESEPCSTNPKSNCPFCSMIPFGACCTHCNHIQTSRAILLSTPPAIAWPMVHKLGNWEGTKKPEEELLQNLDMELFELINVPHELDEWGRRVYNDCGHRIIYCVDEDGNTVMGYEAWYPSSVTGEYEEPRDWRRQPEEPAVEDEGEDTEYDDHGRPVDSDGNIVVGDYEEESQDDVSMLGFEQQRLAKFLAAQNSELPQFQSDRERIAAWIATSSVADGDDGSVLDGETREMVSQWYASVEDFESASPSKAGVLHCSDGSAEEGYVSVPLRRDGVGFGGE